MSDDLSYSLGLEIKNFQQGAQEAIASTRDIHHEIRGIRTAIEAGGVGVIAIGFLRDVADWAEKSGNKLDDNVQALIRWKNALNDTGGIKSVLADIISPFIRAGETIGLTFRAIYEGMHAASSVNSPLQMLKNIASAWVEAVDVQQKSNDLDKQESVNKEKTNRLLDEQTSKLKEIRAEAAKLGEAEMAYNFSQLSTAQQLNQLLGMKKLIESDLANFKGKEVDLEKLLNEQEANSTEIAKTRDKLAKEELKTTDKIVRRRHELTDEMRAQQAVQEALDVAQGKMNILLQDTLIINGKMYGASRDPSQLADASDAQLKEIIRRSKSEISDIRSSEGHGPTALADAATGFLIQGSAIDRLQTDVIRSQYQLDQRGKLRSDIATVGINGARQRFSGDPLAFDRMVDILQDIKDQQRRGLKVVPLGQAGLLPAQNPGGASIPA